MKKLLMLVLVMTINGGNLADIGEVADCGRFTSSYQELAPAPTTDPVAPYLTPDATPWPAKDNIPEAPSEAGCDSPSHNEMENTPASAVNDAPTEEDDNQPSHNDAPAVPTNGPVETPRPAPNNTPAVPIEEATNNPGHNDQPQEPQPATKNTPAAPAQDYVGENNPQHNEQLNPANGAKESNGNPSHSDLLGAEEVSESTVSAVADAGSAPANDLVASIPAAEALASVAEVMANDASNVNTHCDMPTE